MLFWRFFTFLKEREFFFFLRDEGRRPPSLAMTQRVPTSRRRRLLPRQPAPCLILAEEQHLNGTFNFTPFLILD